MSKLYYVISGIVISSSMVTKLWYAMKIQIGFFQFWKILQTNLVVDLVFSILQITS